MDRNTAAKWMFAGILFTVLGACGGGTAPDKTTSKDIDSSGGEIVSTDGRLKLVIPPQALSESTTVTVNEVAREQLPPSFQEGEVATGSRYYEILPDNLTLAQPAKIEFQLSASELDNASLAYHGTHFLLSADPNDQPQLMPSQILNIDAVTGNGVLSGELSQFSPVADLVTLSHRSDNGGSQLQRSFSYGVGQTFSYNIVASLGVDNINTDDSLAQIAVSSQVSTNIGIVDSPVVTAQSQFYPYLNDETEQSGRHYAEAISRFRCDSTGSGTIVMTLTESFNRNPNDNTFISQAAVGNTITLAQILPEEALPNQYRTRYTVPISCTAEDPQPGPTCANPVQREYIRFDLPVTGPGLPTIAAGSEIPLRNISDIESIADAHIQDSGCSVRHLHGNDIYVNGNGPYAEPDRSGQPVSERGCGYGEAYLQTVCLDPVQAGSLETGLHFVRNPQQRFIENSPLSFAQVLNQVSDSQSSQAGVSAGGTSDGGSATGDPSVVKAINGSGSRGFALNNTAFGPLLGFNLDFSFQQKQDLAVDLLHGDVLSTGLTIGANFRFGLSQQVPGPGSRAVTGSGDASSTSAEEYDPAFDASEPTLADVFAAPVTDASLYGYSGNFSGTAAGVVLSNPNAIAVVSFAEPEVPGDRDPNQRFNETTYLGFNYFGSDTIVSAAAVGNGANPDLLVASNSGSGGRLWYLQQGEAIELGTLGSGPRQLRCLDNTLCVVIDTADNSLTTINLLESTLPTIKATISMGDQPTSVDLVRDSSGNYVALAVDTTGEGSHYRLAKLSSDGNVIDLSAYPVDGRCGDPQQAIWVRDTVGMKVLVTCPGTLSPGGKQQAAYWVDDPASRVD